MNTKNTKQWLWKWHVIAGLISVPFILLLAITGGIYLFAFDYDQKKITPIETIRAGGTPLSYQSQWEAADSIQGWKHNAMLLPIDKQKASAFVKGRFSHKKTTYINPYSKTLVGKWSPKQSPMHKVRKLHGELLLGGFGTKIVELIASWMIVLLLTGIIIWWPARGWRMQGFFIPRWKLGKKVLYRDLHAITAFWISGLLLLVLAGGLPWTDVVGANFKRLQKITNTGFPKHWNGMGITQNTNSNIIALDSIVKKAQKLPLAGQVTISFPKGPKGVFSVSNANPKDLNSQKKYHYNASTGALVLEQSWKDVGVLMRGRMWLMAFHQGQFGPWNWYLMLGIAILLSLVSIAGILSYFSKKPKGKWVVPRVPKHFKTPKLVYLCIGGLAIAFPLFGISALLIFVYEKYNNRINN